MLTGTAEAEQNDEHRSETGASGGIELFEPFVAESPVRDIHAVRSSSMGTMSPSMSMRTSTTHGPLVVTKRLLLPDRLVVQMNAPSSGDPRTHPSPTADCTPLCAAG